MDLTVVAIPAYFSTMGAEFLHLKKQSTTRAPIAGDCTDGSCAGFRKESGSAANLSRQRALQKK